MMTPETTTNGARFIADINALAADTPQRQNWALRSAVALGAGAVRFSGAAPDPEVDRLAESLRIPLLPGADPTAPPLALPATLPSPAFCRRLVPPAECNLTSRAMEAAFAPPPDSGALDIPHMLATALGSFRMPTGFDNALRLLQIAQADAAERAAASLRMEGRAATISLAATPPGAPFATLDPDGGWRAAHYRLRHALAPAALAAEYLPADATLLVRAANRRREPLRARLRWRVARLDGLPLDEERTPVAVAPSSSAAVATIPLAGLLRQYPPHQMLVWLSLETEEATSFTPLARGCALLCAPKHLALQDPAISVDVESVPARSAKGSPEWRRGFRLLFPGPEDESESQRDGGHWFRVTLTSLAPALWTWLETPGLDGVHPGDNFLHLESEMPVEILVRSERPLTLRAFRKALRVRSLFDTFVEE